MPNLGLKSRNTFGLDAVADLAYEITSPEQIPAVMSEISEKNLSLIIAQNIFSRGLVTQPV